MVVAIHLNVDVYVLGPGVVGVVCYISGIHWLVVSACNWIADNMLFILNTHECPETLRELMNLPWHEWKAGRVCVVLNEG